jgi:hypothetical protein
MNPHCVSGDSDEVKVLTPQESAADETPAQLREEIQKYLRYLPQVAEPNLARVREIQEQVQQGAYLTREMIEETARRLALRFLRKE